MSAEKSRNISRKLAPLRLIIIDEISQVEAALLYALHLFLESHMQTADTYKRNVTDNTLHAFGGVNIICAGDFMQLPPCKASGDLSLPPPYILGDTVATVDDDDIGRELFWRNVTHTVELVEQVRCKDPWYANVLDELREGRMSDNTYNFLHGLPTSVCGTGAIGDIPCGNEACHSLTIDHEVFECRKCRKERESKIRVICDFEGHKATRAKLQISVNNRDFCKATYVVANNDLKFEICKARAGDFARRSGQIIQWAQCVDIAKDPACKGKLEDLETKSAGGAAAEKAKWLTRHDRDCGNLYGLLPLVKGMEMMLTDHLDRSDKALLRGMKCKVVGWSNSHVYESSQKDIVLPSLPNAIYVKFEDAEWKIDGMSENGVYPIVPVKNGWEFGKKGRMKNRMAVTRQQFALAPAYAITAYSVQGMTLLFAVVNICFSALASVVQGYIAMSRVQYRQNIIIMQSFRKEPFQRGVPIHNQIMMAHFRKETEYRDELVDLHVLKLANQHVCATCLKKHHRRHFSEYEAECEELKISPNREKLTCNTCMGKKRACRTCHLDKRKCDYYADDWDQTDKDGQQRNCKECKAKKVKKCTKCKQFLPQDTFAPDQWEKRRAPGVGRDRTCLECYDDLPPIWVVDRPATRKRPRGGD